MRITMLIAAALLPAAADGPERAPPVTHEPTLQECGECHMAFQPALLPAESWRRIMTGLSDHFGEDASLEPELAAEIEAYLVSNAGGGDGTRLRITEQRWFRHEHDFPDRVWQRPEIRSRANCEACHRNAAQGSYEDD